jgi:hypothetical protein
MTWSMCDLALWLFLIIAICCYRTILYAFARFLRDVGAVGLLWQQRPHDANPRYHRWAAALGDQHQRMGLAKPAAIVAASADFMTFGNTKRPRAAGGNLCRGRPAFLAKAVLPAVGFGFWGREYRF